MNRSLKSPADDEHTPASFEELTGITDERMAEMEMLMAAVEREMAAVNLIPLNKVCEQYIRDRYPISALYGRYDIKEIAYNEHGATLTEDEIQGVSTAFYDAYPDEIHIAIADAIEQVIAERDQKQQ